MRLALTLPILALASLTASAASPTCALLDPEKDPRVALLEAKLLADPEGNWLERAGIDAILKEQELQALFGPQGVGERVKLGKLLKADVLVMVRPVKDAKEPTLELIVGETAGGLRLAVRAIPVTKNAAADVAALLEGVREGLKRRGEAIREVVAVPPFVSNDLEYTHENLKGALAKLAEAEALGRKGVVVVELAEAEALAKELALSPEAKLNRPLPLYLLGEYRHEGTAKDRAVTLKLRAERGGKPVGEPVELKAKAVEGPAAVRKWAAEKLDALAKDETPRPPADPKAEAKVLADRMQLFKRLGNWEESIALAEAALLIDPTQLDLHIAIVGALGDPVEKAQHATHAKKNPEKAAEQFARLYRYGLWHIEAYIIAGGDPARHRAVTNQINSSFVKQFRTRAYYLTVPPNCSPEVKETLLETGRVQRTLFTRLLAAPSVADSLPDTYIDFVHPILTHLTAAEQYAVLERAIADLPDRPDSASKAKIFVSSGFWASDEPGKYGTGKAYEAFKARITDDKFKFASTSKEELKRLERVEAERKAVKPVPLPADPQADDVRLTLVKLEIDGKVPSGPETLKRFYGILAVGKALDVVWDGSNMYTMKEKGKLVPVRLPAGWDGTTATDVVFDGKFVWTSGGQSRNGAILAAFDPASGKVCDLTTVDGLPQPAAESGKTNSSLAIAPLGPGRVCVAGFNGRGWVATVSLDTDKGGSAKVIHEARDVPDRQKTDQWKKTTIAFTPASARTLRGSADGKPITRVLIGRSQTGIFEIDTHSLLVDPDTGAAEVFETATESFGFRNGMKQAGPAPGGVLYYQGHADKRDSLLRMTLPGPKIETVAKELPVRLRGIFPEESKFHLIEHVPPLPGAAPDSARSRWTASWSILEADAKRPRLVGTGLLQINTVGVSMHYGLVAIAQTLDRDPRCEIYTVEIAAAKK